MRPGKNGGQLRTGNVGGKGGTGRPPSELRDRLRGSFADRIRVLEQYADGVVALQEKCPQCGYEGDMAAKLPEHSDRLRAIDMLAKYGLGAMKEVSVENVRERVRGTLDVIRAHCSADQAASIIRELHPIWA